MDAFAILFLIIIGIFVVMACAGLIEVLFYLVFYGALIAVIFCGAVAVCRKLLK